MAQVTAADADHAAKRRHPWWRAALWIFLALLLLGIAVRALLPGWVLNYVNHTLDRSHRGMGITNAEFDASIGAMKASLDRLGVPAAEQRELLAILETTRPQIVERR